MKKRLITSALPYINGVKHLGNLVGSMLPADIYARYSRQNNHTVLYICGTDEHGAPAEIAAHNEGVSVEEYCDKYHKIQKDIYQRFNLSFDYFGRTSSSSHHKFTKEVFESIISNGYIYQDEIEQYYSIDDQRYLPDRYIEGSCPECGFKSARGDQCDGCGCLLNPSELIEPYSALSGSKNLELRKTSHLFLDLKKLEGSLSQWLDKKTEWPELVRGISRKWLKEGLQSRCITRDLDWGIKVPLNDDTLKALYVWFDAPLGYISFTQEWAALQNSGDDWKSWWKEPGNVELVQFMAKDNVPFHTIFWPAMMMASTKNENENEWTLANYIKGVNWLTYEGGKFSTSQKIGVFTDKALELYPADYWRFALFSMMPEKSDSSFSFELFALAINKDLADSVGNFVSRLCKMIEKNFTEATIPAGFEVDQCL
ncbi:MAG: methionyl-tRNA synthetase, partial [Psychromonas sp.]